MSRTRCFSPIGLSTFWCVQTFMIFVLIGAPGHAQKAPMTFPTWRLMETGQIDKKILAPNDHELVAIYHMLPERMLKLDEDVLQDNGRIAAPAGTQLVVLRGVDVAACAIFPPKLALGAAIFAWGADRHLCFIDRNRDGQFESYYFTQGNSQGFYNVIQSLPNTLKATTGGRYSAADPTTLERGLHWHVDFQGCKVITRKHAEQKRCRIFVGLDVLKDDGDLKGGQTLNYGRQFDIFPETGGARVGLLGLSVVTDWKSEDAVHVTIVQDAVTRPFLLR